MVIGAWFSHAPWEFFQESMNFFLIQQNIDTMESSWYIKNLLMTALFNREFYPPISFLSSVSTLKIVRNADLAAARLGFWLHQTPGNRYKLFYRHELSRLTHAAAGGLDYDCSRWHDDAWGDHHLQHFRYILCIAVFLLYKGFSTNTDVVILVKRGFFLDYPTVLSSTMGQSRDGRIQGVQLYARSNFKITLSEAKKPVSCNVAKSLSSGW